MKKTLLVAALAASFALMGCETNQDARNGHWRRRGRHHR